jgi:hypothetical protein
MWCEGQTQEFFFHSETLRNFVQPLRNLVIQLFAITQKPKVAQNLFAYRPKLNDKFLTIVF